MSLEEMNNQLTQFLLTLLPDDIEDVRRDIIATFFEFIFNNLQQNISREIEETDNIVLTNVAYDQWLSNFLLSLYYKCAKCHREIMQISGIDTYLRLDQTDYVLPSTFKKDFTDLCVKEYESAVLNLDLGDRPSNLVIAMEMTSISDTFEQFDNNDAEIGLCKRINSFTIKNPVQTMEIEKEALQQVLQYVFDKYCSQKTMQIFFQKIANWLKNLVQYKNNYE